MRRAQLFAGVSVSLTCSPCLFEATLEERAAGAVPAGTVGALGIEAGSDCRLHHLDIAAHRCPVQWMGTLVVAQHGWPGSEFGPAKRRFLCQGVRGREDHDAVRGIHLPQLRLQGAKMLAAGTALAEAHRCANANAGQGTIEVCGVPGVNPVAVERRPIPLRGNALLGLSSRALPSVLLQLTGHYTTNSQPNIFASDDITKKGCTGGGADNRLEMSTSADFDLFTDGNKFAADCKSDAQILVQS